MGGGGARATGRFLGAALVSLLFVSKKRPYAAEGHLHLPRDLRPSPAPAPDGRGPFDPAGETWTMVVPEDAPSVGVRAGDHVVLVRGQPPEFGDVVAARDEDGALRLWRARPEAGALRLVGEDRTLTLPPSAAVGGVVVAVLRRF